MIRVAIKLAEGESGSEVLKRGEYQIYRGTHESLKNAVYLEDTAGKRKVIDGNNQTVSRKTETRKCHLEIIIGENEVRLKDHDSTSGSSFEREYFKEKVISSSGEYTLSVGSFNFNLSIEND